MRRKLFVPTFRRYYEDNKCMQTKSCPVVFILFMSVLMFLFKMGMEAKWSFNPASLMVVL